MPSVSIIMPAYNAEKTIEKSIDSILSQTMHDWELIIVNDGSQDNTEKVCDLYCGKDRRIHLISTVNQGVSKARNVGLDSANGEYIIFMDSDDIVEPNCLEMMFFYAQKSNSDVVLAGIKISEDGQIKDCVPDEHVVNESLAFWDKLYCLQKSTGLVGYVSNKMYRRSIIEEHSIIFNPNKSLQEDLDFALNIFSKTESVIFISESFYLYYYEYKKRPSKAAFATIDNDIYFFSKMYSSEHRKNELLSELASSIFEKLYSVLYWCDNYKEIKNDIKNIRNNVYFNEFYAKSKNVGNAFCQIMKLFLKLKLEAMAYFFVRIRRNVAKAIHLLR